MRWLATTGKTAFAVSSAQARQEPNQAPAGTIKGDSEMIRELFIAFVVLIITVASTAWLNAGPRRNVQQVQVEASLAK
jgi:hypothetical protein